MEADEYTPEASEDDRYGLTANQANIFLTEALLEAGHNILDIIEINEYYGELQSVI